MERLLAHPATLPLVHADHSHRASPARTGKCHRVTNPSRVLASYTVVTRDGNRPAEEHEASFTYFLFELKCGTAHPKASADVSKQALSNIVLMAKRAAKDLRKSVSVETVDPDGKKDYLVWVDESGHEVWAFTGDKEKAQEHVQMFLTEYYAEDDGPKFLIQPDSPPYYY